MDDIIANVDDFKFDIEAALTEQLGIQPLPFPGMDKSGAAICDFFLMNNCLRGQLCPLRHIRGDRMIVCKHWLRGLCKKGDDCEFLHQYDMEKMPECYFYNKYGSCSNKECPFLHLDPEAKIKDCPWYDRGFCKHGPLCKNRHVRRVLCVNYLCGFCPLGKKCKQSHPRHELPQYEPRGPFNIVCHACGEVGHKSSHCAVAKRLAAEAVMRGELPEELRLEGQSENQPPSSMPDEPNPQIPNGLPPMQQSEPPLMQPPQQQQQQHPQQQPVGPMDNDPGAPAAYIPYGKRPLEFVTCFKCRGKGHYANRCPFGATDRQAGIPRSFRDRQMDVRPDLQRSVRMHMQNMHQHMQQHQQQASLGPMPPAQHNPMRNPPPNLPPP